MILQTVSIRLQLETPIMPGCYQHKGNKCESMMTRQTLHLIQHPVHECIWSSRQQILSTWCFFFWFFWIMVLLQSRHTDEKLTFFIVLLAFVCCDACVRMNSKAAEIALQHRLPVILGAGSVGGIFKINGRIGKLGRNKRRRSASYVPGSAWCPVSFWELKFVQRMGVGSNHDV